MHSAKIKNSLSLSNPVQAAHQVFLSFQFHLIFLVIFFFKICYYMGQYSCIPFCCFQPDVFETPFKF
jgi:hypothetical protein